MLCLHGIRYVSLVRGAGRVVGHGIPPQIRGQLVFQLSILVPENLVFAGPGLQLAVGVSVRRLLLLLLGGLLVPALATATDLAIILPVCRLDLFGLLWLELVTS